MTMNPEQARQAHATAALYVPEGVRELCTTLEIDGEQNGWQAIAPCSPAVAARGAETHFDTPAGCQGQCDCHHPDRDANTEAMIELHNASLRDFSRPGSNGPALWPVRP
jgi:hypothetical protein